MKRVFVQILCGIFALCCVAISAFLFWNELCYADANNVSVTAMYGGPLNFCLNWLQMGLMVVVAIMSFANIFSGRKKSKEKKKKNGKEKEVPDDVPAAEPISAPADAAGIPFRPASPDSAAADAPADADTAAKP